MSKSIALSMLRQGNTGSEILSILDAIVGDTVSNSDSESFGGGEPTAHEIEF
jgi:hypothetical protein